MWGILQVNDGTMLRIEGCQCLAGLTRLLRYTSWSHTRYKSSLVRCDFEMRAFHTSALATAAKMKMQVRTIKLNGSESDSKKNSQKNSKDNRPQSVAARLVDAAPPEIQPYMKLMRIDKPIGEQL